MTRELGLTHRVGLTDPRPWVTAVRACNATATNRLPASPLCESHVAVGGGVAAMSERAATPPSAVTPHATPLGTARGRSGASPQQQNPVFPA